LFCRFDAQDWLLPIPTTPAMIPMVGAGRIPVPIPDQEIDAIQTAIHSGLYASHGRT
jgi:hypothetical protein